MARNMVKIRQRREHILNHIKRDGMVSVTTLVDELGATAVTIRNDLDALEQEGLLRRVPGGAVPVPTDLVSNLFEQRRKMCNAEEKEVIAGLVAGLIHDGESLFINSGTTTQAVAVSLKSKRYLNIVTNSIPVALELGDVPTFRVILLGGEVNSRYGISHGINAQEQLEHFRADWAILSLDGIDSLGGMTTTHPEEVLINCAMMNHATKIAIAADHSKIGRTGFIWFRDIGSTMTLVTDSDAPAQQLEELRRRGVTVVQP